MADDHNMLDHDAVRKILDERARALARPAAAGEQEPTMMVVVLRLNGEQYGIDVGSIREIQRCAAVSPVPGTPPFWRGLVNLRGRLLPVLDLARFLGLPGADAAAAGVVVVVEAANLEVGLAVDDMPEIRRLRQHEVGPPVYQAAGLRTHARGVTSDLLTLLDIAALLEDPKLVVHADEIYS